jgi:6-phosphogluconate dehydrogenase
MELGMIGLGKMGGFMAERLLKGGHRVVGLDRDAAAVNRVVEKGAAGADTLGKLIGQLKTPRAIWLMVPAGPPVDQTIEQLLPHLSPGDTIIDGGNSYYRDSMRRAAALAAKKINFLDSGTSGGVWGLTEGYSLMIGGEEAVVKQWAPIFETLAPGKDKGWGRVGPAGAGHFVKMVHNGIEYGIMQAYAEGFDIFKNATSKDLPANIRYSLNLSDIAEVWRRGSVISSWLLDLTSMALVENPELTEYSGYVQDSGEGRWTIQAAVEEAVPAEVLTAALYARFRSRQEHTFADKMLSAMRQKFGGHVELKPPGKS